MDAHRLIGLSVLACLAGAGTAPAQVSSERAASLVVFPKVVHDGTRDTLIQLVSTASTVAYVHCWYVNAAPTFPELPPGPLNPPLWWTLDFDLALLKEQPISFTAGRGRPVDPGDPPCSRVPPQADCYGAGADPGRVPPTGLGFTGELRCLQTDASGAPLSGNQLIGEATLVDAASGDAVKYSAVGVVGLETNDGDDELRLGEEYAACPQELVLVNAPDGGEDAQLGSGSTIATELTMVACSTDLDVGEPAGLIVLVNAFNDLGQQFSTAATVDGWRTVRLSDVSPVLGAEVLTGSVSQLRLRVSAGTASGMLAVAEETHVAADGRRAGAAANLHTVGARSAVDVITLR